MSVTEIAMAIPSTEPFRTILSHIAKARSGRRILNWLSAPYGLFDTFEEGWLAARKARPAGHEHPDDIAIHLALSMDLRPSDYAALYWLCQIASADIRIFDFGGNVGNLYYSYSPYLRGKFHAIEWTVLDLPLIVEEGKKLSARWETPEMRFTLSTADALGCSVLLVSGAFHYWEKSVPAFLEQFVELPEHIILNRTPVHDAQPSFISVQCTKSYAVPCIVRNAPQLVAEFTAAGYTLIDRWPALELKLRPPLFPDHAVQHYSGFYFRRGRAT
jgi:putative methyltransferase (TIGR04325 family)